MFVDAVDRRCVKQRAEFGDNGVKVTGPIDEKSDTPATSTPARTPVFIKQKNKLSNKNALCDYARPTLSHKVLALPPENAARPYGLGCRP